MIKSAFSVAVLALALAAPASAAGDAFPLGLNNNWCGGWGCGWGGYGRRSFNQTIVVQAGNANQARLADSNYNDRPPRAVPFDPNARAGCDFVRGVYLCTVR
jgi:hypothetical protein